MFDYLECLFFSVYIVKIQRNQHKAIMAKLNPPVKNMHGLVVCFEPSVSGGV